MGDSALEKKIKIQPTKNVRGGRFELPTHGSLRVGTLQSTALPTELPPGNDAPTWDRTKDLVVNSHSLYQLSYRGIGLEFRAQGV